MDKAQVERLIRQKIEKEPGRLIPVKSLVKLGLKRYSCRVCGKNFWSHEERDLCGDVECVGDYSFLDNNPMALKDDYIGIWRRFSRMFGRFGHEEIKRYPVVARWRDDIYFVEAAIDDFAPYVITGVANPPSNPLIVPQICLRFNDINNIGLSGRHLTSFIMAEEAAFNTAKKKTYFDEKAIMYIYEWLTKGLKIDKKALTFVEDAWAGAGYAGSSLEFFVGGVELGNQVYMRYIIDGDDLKEIPTKTIDMGAGLNRWVWMSQNTPTVYEAVFPRVVDYIKKKTGVSYDSTFLKKLYKFSGRIDYEKTPFDEAVKDISKNSGLDEVSVRKALGDMQAVYSIADHARTLLVAIHDGALPSNVGGGYNLRNILRRSLAFIDNKGWKLDINDVINEHKKEFGSWFTELKEFDISQIIDKEVERYRDFKARNLKLISDLLEKGKIDDKEMRELYESRGITIDDIKIRAEAEGRNVELPEKFYSEINSPVGIRHAGNRPNVSGLKKTEKLFYDERLTETKAKVVKKLGDREVILDRTIFYPEMGGQKSDRGTIGGSNVSDVNIYDNIVVHKLERPLAATVGKTVEIRIDTDRRELLRRHHTATHIINQAARRVLGEFVYQNGAEKDVDKAHLDITYYDRLTEQQIKAIEDLANEVVASNIEITVKTMGRTEAEKRYGMSIYQGGAIPNAQLRVVRIGDYDVEACGGLHCNRSGDVGIIKIIKSERIQDGVVRLTYVAYRPAIKYIQSVEDTLRVLTDMWGVRREDLEKTAQRFFQESKRYRELYEESEAERIRAIAWQQKGNETIEIKTHLDNLGILMRAVDGLQKDRRLIINSDKMALGAPADADMANALKAKGYKNIVNKGPYYLAYG